MTLVLPQAEFRAPWLTYTFVSMTALFIYALPFIVVSSATLMAKFTDESQQSTIQGIRVAAERVAQICGPLWGAEVLHNFYLVFIFPAIFLLITMTLQTLSWSWLDFNLFKKESQIQKQTKKEKRTDYLLENNEN
jgi:predicted MFS family arabinose efflux permease